MNALVVFVVEGTVDGAGTVECLFSVASAEGLLEEIGKKKQKLLAEGKLVGVSAVVVLP
jgi:hypothetical protein